MAFDIPLPTTIIMACRHHSLSLLSSSSSGSDSSILIESTRGPSTSPPMTSPMPEELKSKKPHLKRKRGSSYSDTDVRNNASHRVTWRFSLGSTWHELAAPLWVLSAAIPV